MKRRTFVITTTAAALAVISIPVIKYYNKSKYNPLIMPDELSRFCDEKTIREIGTNYRNLTPQEADKKKLTDLLLTADDGKLVTASDKPKVIELLDKKVHDDFLGSKIQVISGWVISVTEARQCALFSLT